MVVEFNEKYNFNHIISEDGMVITDYTEEMDIKDYSSSKEMYCPVTIDISRYYEISDEVDAEYREAQERAFRDEEMRNRGE